MKSYVIALFCICIVFMLVDTIIKFKTPNKTKEEEYMIYINIVLVTILGISLYYVTQVV